MNIDCGMRHQIERQIAVIKTKANRFNTSGVLGIQCYCLWSGTVEPSLWNHENMFETGVVRANEC